MNESGKFFCALQRTFQILRLVRRAIAIFTSMNFKRFLLVFSISMLHYAGKVSAQVGSVPLRLKWQVSRIEPKNPNLPARLYTFPNAFFYLHAPYHAFYTAMEPCADSLLVQQVRVNTIKESPVTDSALRRQLLHIGQEYEGIAEYAVPGMATIYINPYRKGEAGEIFRLESGTYTIYMRPAASSVSSAGKIKSGSHNQRALNTSLLAAGNWHKIGVTQEGVYKMDFGFLNATGLIKSANDLKYLKLYGKPGGMLAENNADTEAEYMRENAIMVVDNDGVWNADDYVLFYAEGPVSWSASPTGDIVHTQNRYVDTAYYFLTVDTEPGKRIQENAPGAAGNILIDSFDTYAVHEWDRITEINTELKSGSELFGEDFRALNGNTQISKNIELALPGAVAGTRGILRVQFMARAEELTRLDIALNGRLQRTMRFGAVDLNDQEGPYGTLESSSINTGADMSARNTIGLTFNKTRLESIGWLGYIEMQARVPLRAAQGQMNFRSLAAKGTGLAEYKIQGAGPQTTVWDITDFHEVAVQKTEPDASGRRFSAAVASPRRYVMFDGSAFLTPRSFGSISNQNILAAGPVDMIIISHPEFLPAARRLADFHHSTEGLVSVIVTPQELYNEYNYGGRDPMAYRLYAKMLYERAKAHSGSRLPKFMLLMGDATYDLKNLTPGNPNYVMTYESLNTAHYINSFCSDDFFACFVPKGGDWSRGYGETTNGDTISLGVGRMPVRSLQNAHEMVDKVIAYYARPSQGAWRNDVTMVADDEDGNLYFNQTEALTNTLSGQYPDLNFNKVYFDAYRQVSVASGNRYPQVNAAFNTAMEKGCVVLNYIGHGREQGLGHERVLEIPDINSWKNINNMPVFVTATCSFGRFDDPAFQSAGELCYLNPHGGSIAMLTTTRIVSAGANYELLKNVFINNLFKRDSDGRSRHFGDVVKRAKNQYAISNTRNFTLLGDPALRIALPHYKVVTDSITGIGSGRDTLAALSKITITGHVETDNGPASDWDGVVTITVFDKTYEKMTLANDPGSMARPFKVRDKIIYNGSVTVEKGRFKAGFIVPRDINWGMGGGRISYYSYSGTRDAAGSDERIIVGGGSRIPVIDTIGPQVKLFLNDTNFVNGGLTDENPVLLAYIFDESGMNSIGNGVGHDMIVTLDENTQYTVNQYYASDINDFRKGKVIFPLQNLTDGYHRISLRVWDVNNNPGEAALNFVVASAHKLKVEKVLNFPNPFSANTTFQFEHNRPDENLSVSLQIYNTQGQLIRTLYQMQKLNGNRSTALTWDGTDQSGAPLAAGVYIYRLSLSSQDGQTVAAHGKLVLVK